MESKRKIVLVLGNGFDLDLDLKTSYSDFYHSEKCPKTIAAPLIQHLNSWSQYSLDKVRWYDLENEILNYYNTLQDPSHPIICFTDNEIECLHDLELKSRREPVSSQEIKHNEVLKSLIDKKLVKKETDGYLVPSYGYDPAVFPLKNTIDSLDDIALGAIQYGLKEYLNTIKSATINKESVAYNVMQILKDICIKTEYSITIYNFNFTLLDDGLGDFSYPQRKEHTNEEKDIENKKSIPVFYMHGALDNDFSPTVIIGTRDDERIAHNYAFIQKAMDPFYRPPDIISALDEADVVIIFGHSLGENDKQYFAPFFKKQAEDNAKRKGIIIFTYDWNSEVEIKRSLQKLSGNRLSMLSGKNVLRVFRTQDIINGNNDTEVKPRKRYLETLENYLREIANTPLD